MIGSAPVEAEESDLVRSAARGDRAAQQVLFDRHQRGVMGYCLLASNGDREGALELTQETFLRALSSLGQLQEPGRFRGWLFSIAANLCRGRGAQEARRREILAVAQLSLDATPGGDEDPQEREARIALVQRLLSRLRDPDVRAVVSLKYGEPEHTTREIASRLGLPHGTVTSRLVRFRAAIKRELLRTMVEEGS
jgi:RNA polymerase sigma-70 factor (ECF subfamily)